MKSMSRALLVLFAIQLLVWPMTVAAKPKVAVQVKVDEGIGKNLPQDSLSKSGSAMAGALVGQQVYFFNVTVLSDHADAVAVNKGQWCIKGDTLLGSVVYQGTLSGNDLEVEVPQPNGKVKKLSFAVYDHKWRKLSDL
jgi:hypothetical protein